MINQQHSIGRPLAKKSVARFNMQPFEDDEGYGASPPASSFQARKNVFTFADSSLSEKSFVKTAVEDDWTLLANELNQVLNLQPASAVTRKKKSITKANCFSQTSVIPPKSDNFSYTSVPPPKFNSFSHTSIPPIKSKETDVGNRSRKIHCQFCAKNGEVRRVVESHTLRHPITRVIICPVLRNYVCDLCGASGDNAHTRFYCPRNQSQKTPTAVVLKSTRNNAAGRRIRT